MKIIFYYSIGLRLVASKTFAMVTAHDVQLSILFFVGYPVPVRAIISGRNAGCDYNRSIYRTNASSHSQFIRYGNTAV